MSQVIATTQERKFHRTGLRGVSELRSRRRDIVGAIVSGSLSESFICIQSFTNHFITLNKDNAGNVWFICPLTHMCNPSLKP